MDKGVSIVLPLWFCRETLGSSLSSGWKLEDALLSLGVAELLRLSGFEVWLDCRGLGGDGLGAVDALA